MTTPPLTIGVRPAAVAARDALDRALSEGDPPCAGRTEWISDQPEEREWAAHRCWPCPVIELCGQYARVNREPVGVWAGIDRTKLTRKELEA